MREREPEARSEELLDVWTADIISLFNLNHAKDLDRPEACAVASGHVLVQGFDGGSTGELTELFVHVVCTRARVVPDPNTKVLDFERPPLVDNVYTDDLSGCLFDLLKLPKIVPEPRLCNDLIGCKDTHAVDFWCWIICCGQMAADDLIFNEAHLVWRMCWILLAGRFDGLTRSSCVGKA